MDLYSSKTIILIRNCSIILLLLSDISLSNNNLQNLHELSSQRARDLGIEIGLMKPGALNAITDVTGVRVGHKTLIVDNHIRTGVTAILPHEDNIFQEKVPAAIYCYNAFGKLAGYTQVDELGNIETPIILTNTLSVGTAVSAVVRYALQQPGNENIRSVNAVVGETNDGYLNDIRGQHIKENDVIEAILSASSGLPREGSIGAGTGTTAFGFKGGIGTSSRVTPRIGGRYYTVGVLVQSNFGWELTINGVPFSRELRQQTPNNEDGSCMIIIATDAPLSSRNLKRLAKRSFAGMARTRVVMSNGSGDYAIAFSTAYRIPDKDDNQLLTLPPLVNNNAMNDLFRAAEEAVQEAIYNSLFMATTVTGNKGHTRKAISLKQVVTAMKKYNMLNLRSNLNWSPYFYED